MLPEFLLADNHVENPEYFYVVHTSEPKFIVEFDSEDFNKKQKVHWIDPEPAAEVICDLMQRAEDFYNAEFGELDDFVDDQE